MLKNKIVLISRKIYKSKFIKFIIKLLDQLDKDELKGAPAEIAFFLVIAFVPALVFLIQIMTFFNIEINALTNLFTDYIPSEVENTLVEIEKNQHKSFNSFYFITFTITMLWIVSKGYYSLERLSNTTYGLQETRSGFFRRLAALVMTFFILIIIMGTIVFHLFSKSFILLLQDVFYSSDVPFFMMLKTVVNLFLIFILISILMFVTPNKKIKYKNVIVGSVFTTLVWFVYSYIFGFYINNIASYDRFYGGLTGLIIFMVWVYTLAYSLFLGIQMNFLLEKNNTTKESDIRLWKKMIKINK